MDGRAREFDHRKPAAAAVAEEALVPDRSPRSRGSCNEQAGHRILICPSQGMSCTRGQGEVHFLGWGTNPRRCRCRGTCGTSAVRDRPALWTDFGSRRMRRYLPRYPAGVHLQSRRRQEAAEGPVTFLSVSFYREGHTSWLIPPCGLSVETCGGIGNILLVALYKQLYIAKYNNVAEQTFLTVIKEP